MRSSEVDQREALTQNFPRSAQNLGLNQILDLIRGVHHLRDRMGDPAAKKTFPKEPLSVWTGVLVANLIVGEKEKSFATVKHSRRVKLEVSSLSLSFSMGTVVIPVK